MNPPGQPPYGPPGPPPGPPMPPGPPGMGMPPGPGMPGPGMYGPPPPRKSGGGALVALLIAGAILVLVVIGAGAFVVLGGDDDDDPDITLPTPSRTSSSLTTDEPTTTTTGGTDPSGVLKSTIRTATGSTYTQVGTRTGTCTARANSTLATRLRIYPCTDNLYSAVYASPTRNIVTVVSIMKLSSASSASRVSSAVNSEGWPKLLKPATTSGLPQLSTEPDFWTRAWTLDSRVVYAQSYWARGGATGGREGSVYKAAGELGTEVVNTLRFAN